MNLRPYLLRALVSAPWLAAFISMVLLLASVSCGARDELYIDEFPNDVGGQTGTGGQGGQAPPVERANAVDLLLVVDNSGSMADKQEVLGAAVPDLISGLVNPLCLDENGVPAPDQPTELEACQQGTSRRFAPVRDLHVGILTSSLGGHGADSCNVEQQPLADDKGQLVARNAQLQPVTTYGGLGFLAWDPLQQLSPPGETNLTSLGTTLQTMVLGAGQRGCGYEAPLEAWYRFLVEPDPHQLITIQNDEAVLLGTDEVVLKQRRDFLRADSLLMIIVLSDENDCSIRDGGQFYLPAQRQDLNNNDFRMPKPRAACATDPNDPCCRSCFQAPGPGCSDALDDCALPLAQEDDHTNVRCWDQKRRFGIDFMWPLERYAEGLNNPQVSDRYGDVQPNPIFSNAPGQGGDGVRTPDLVLYASLVGVPWQDIARRDANGRPDLLNGLDGDGVPNGGLQSAEELIANDTWALILGDPSSYHTDPAALPTDPLMVESQLPRSGVHPILGVPVEPPEAGYVANPINGHEYSIPNRNFLQYVCIFPLSVPRDCTEEFACNCAPGVDNPVCQAADGSYTDYLQRFGNAYPGIRHLQLMKSLGSQAVVSSICPAQLTNPNALDFGYRPLVSSLLERSASFLEQ